MDWFSVLKNQVASTKGKQFQLDFNQPMVEDDNCKDKLMAVVRKLEGVTSLKGITGENTRSGTARTFSFPEGYTVSLTYRGELDEVPEEVCCKVIETYNKFADGDLEIFEFLGYHIIIFKNTDSLGEPDSGVEANTTISIRDIYEPFTMYRVNIKCSATSIKEMMFDPNPWNKGLELCKKLTKEYVKL